MEIKAANGTVLWRNNGSLRGAELCGLDLSCAQLQGVDLNATNFCESILRGADLTEAVLTEANLLPSPVFTRLLVQRFSSSLHIPACSVL